MPDDINTQVVTSPAFLDGISEEYHSAISGFNSKDALAKGYSDLYSKMGNRVEMPNENTPPEERSAFYNKLGRPETKEGYIIEKPTLPEGMSYDEKFEMTMRGIAHEAGITQTQLKALIKAYNEYQVATFGEASNEAARTLAESDRVLHEKWGADYKSNFEIVERACVELIPDTELREKFAQLVDEKGIRNHPVFGEVFLGIAKSMMNDTYVKSDSQVVNKEYVPQYPNDPDMYRNGTDDESIKARAWHEAKGHVY